MQRYKYKTYNREYMSSLEQQLHLNDMARQGWYLVTVYLPNSDMTYSRYVFKQPIDDGPDHK